MGTSEKKKPTVEYVKLFKVALFVKSSRHTFCALLAWLRPEAISIVWVSYFAEPITAECYSNYILLGGAMKCEELRNNNNKNNNNRLSQLRETESLAVSSPDESNLPLPADSLPWLMQVGKEAHNIDLYGFMISLSLKLLNMCLQYCFSIKGTIRFESALKIPETGRLWKAEL